MRLSRALDVLPIEPSPENLLNLTVLDVLGIPNVGQP